MKSIGCFIISASNANHFEVVRGDDVVMLSALSKTTLLSEQDGNMPF
jgi:hypothetical protein